MPREDAARTPVRTAGIMERRTAPCFQFLPSLTDACVVQHSSASSHYAYHVAAAASSPSSSSLSFIRFMAALASSVRASAGGRRHWWTGLAHVRGGCLGYCKRTASMDRGARTCHMFAAAARRVVRVPKPFMDGRITAWAGWWECSRGPMFTRLRCRASVCLSARGRADRCGVLAYRPSAASASVVRVALGVVVVVTRSSIIYSCFRSFPLLLGLFVNKKHWTVDRRVKGGRRGISRRGALTGTRVSRCAIVPFRPFVRGAGCERAQRNKRQGANFVRASSVRCAASGRERPVPSLPHPSIHPSVHPSSSSQSAS